MISLPTSPAQITTDSTLYAGIDVAKTRFVVALVSTRLLQDKRFEQCPTFSFTQDRAGVVAFLERIKAYEPDPAHVAIVLENTGHYHRPLTELLAGEGFQVFRVAIHTKRRASASKTDITDARNLALRLYNQIEHGVQLETKSHEVRQLHPATDAALQLHGLVRRHYELRQEHTRLENKYIAISDELFPELTQIFKDPCLPIAMDVVHRFPTPAILASKNLEEVSVVKRSSGPSDAKLLKLLELSRSSIGVTSTARVSSLCLEQRQLAEDMQLAKQHIALLETRIQELVASCREGQILLSMPCVGHLHAATILASVGNIRNFKDKSALRKYCGWAPRSTQTGSSKDRDDMAPDGSRLLKRAFYLLAMTSVCHPDNNVWGRLYQRLVPIKCPLDPRTRQRKGRMKVIGRIAGQMVGVVFALLKQDADLVDQRPGEPLPDPQLYDAAVHAGSKSKLSIDSPGDDK